MNRTYRRLIAVGTAGMLLLGATACAGSSAAPADSEAVPSSPSAVPSSPSAVPSSPSAAPAPEYDTSYDIAAPQIAQTAIDRFGAREARRGVATAVDFHTTFAFNSALLAAELPEQADLARSVGIWMTEVGRKDWDAALASHLNAPKGRYGKKSPAVFAITFYDPYRDGKTTANKPLDVNRDGPAAVNPRITSVVADLDPGSGGLRVKVKSAADLRLVHGGKPVLVRVDRTTTYWMWFGYDKWKIDGWYGKDKFQRKARPDRGAR